MAGGLDEFGGREEFSAPPERVYEVLTSIDSLAATIPDVESCTKTGERAIECVVRPGFSFLRGTLRLRIELCDLDAPRTATMLLDAQGIGVNLKAVSKLEITRSENGSNLHWQTQITQLKGLIATVSPGLIKAAADKVIRQGWDQIRASL